LIVRVRRLLYARGVLGGAFIEVDRLFVPQQRPATALLSFQFRVLLLELVQVLGDVRLIQG
jgi:hypothetical protein